MNAETVIFVILPYISLTILVVGLIWRRRTVRYGWSAGATQRRESKPLRFGSVLFHLGVLAAIGGHVMGLLIPESWTSAVGITDSMYHVVAVIGGISAGTAVIIGFAALIYRRIRFPRIRVTTTNMDIAVFGLLAFGIVTGMLATLTNIGDSVHYRESVAPYFRQLFMLNPEPSLMTGEDISLIFQIHVTGVWFLYALWPFSRLVHAFSVPVGYPKRSPIFYRSRSSRPPTESRPEARATQ